MRPCGRHVGRCIRAASGSAAGSVKRDPPMTGGRTGDERQAQGAATRSSDAVQADGSGGPSDRPGAADAIEIATQDECVAIVSDTQECEVVRAWTGRVDDSERNIARVQHLEVGQLADRVRQGPAAGRTGQYLDPEVLGNAFRTGRMVGIDVGQGDCLDPPAPPGGEADGEVETGSGRVARVHEDEPAATDEIGADRLARDATAGGHDDPGHTGRDLLLEHGAKPAGREPGPDLVDRTDVLELLERGARRQPERHRTGCHRLERGGRSKPDVGRRPRRPRTRGSLHPGAPLRRTGHRTAAGTRAGSPSATAGRAGRCEDEGRARRPRTRAWRRRRAARSAPPRRVPPAHPYRRARRRPLRTAHGGRRDTRPGRPRARGRRRAPSPRPPRDHRPRGKPRIGVGGVHPPAREDMRTAGERHRRRAVREQRLEPLGPRPEQDDGRRRTRLDLALRHGASSCAARAVVSVTGRRQTKPRQTYAVGRPSSATRSVSNGTTLAATSAATDTTWFGR